MKAILSLAINEIPCNLQNQLKFPRIIAAAYKNHLKPLADLKSNETTTRLLTDFEIMVLFMGLTVIIVYYNHLKIFLGFADEADQEAT
jgi:hypothetical protein